MDKLLICVFVISNLFVTCSSAKGSYAIVVPTILRPGRTLDISVQILNISDPISVTATVTPSIWSKTVVAEKIQNIQKQGMISLNIPTTATRATYAVTVTGSGTTLEFTKQTTISTELKTMSVLIQTDKGMYKPGKVVKFRVMGIDSKLLPYSGSFDVTVKDPNKSIIKKVTGVKGNQGIYSSELRLSEEPVLGEWTIIATPQMSKDNEKTVSFTVAEYVLPKFAVSLNLPSYILPESKSMVATVTARYTYGKNVKGKGEISLKLRGSSFESTTYKYATLKRTIILENGKADVTFTREDLISLAGTRKCETAMCYSDEPNVALYAQMEYSLMRKTIDISSTIAEDLTGNTFTSNGTVEVIKYPFTVEFIKFSPTTFKPGLNWTGVVQIKKKDGSNPSESDLRTQSGDPVKLVVTTSCYTQYYRSISNEYKYDLDTTGLVEITFKPNMSDSSCNVKAKFKFAYADMSVQKFLSKSQNGIQLTVPGLAGAIKVGKYVLFEVTSTEIIQGFYYQLLSKGLIIKQNYIQSSGVGNMTEFSIMFDKTLCRQASPNARMIVWYMTSTAEIIADSIDFTVDGAFANNVSLQFSKKETKPGDTVSLTVNSYPSSVVGLLAIDQSVSLLGGANDITQGEIMSELRSYDSSKPVSSNRMFFDWWWPVYSGGKDTAQLLKNAGINVLTDGLVYDHDELYYMHGPEMMPDMAPGGAQPGRTATMPSTTPRMTTTSTFMRTATAQGMTTPGYADKVAVETPLKEPARIRTEFPETWIWTEEISGADGKVTLDRQVPDTITSWMASAFAMHDTVGLGVAENMAKITVIKPFFVSLNLPYSMIRGEEVALQATVFNYMKQDIRVVVTLDASSMFKVKHPNGIEPTKGQNVSQTITVPAGDGVLTSFWIIPIVLGQVPVSVKARSTVAADAVVRNILVEPEGEPQEFSKNLLIKLDTNNDYFTESMSIDYPLTDIVPGSQRVVFTAIGDIMGPSIGGLDQLLKMPYGCGEQNMVKFAPNIYIMDYLMATNQLTDDIKNKAMNYLESGYQRELTYQRSDGSFSAFGNRDKAGSMWLTAFVIRCFNQAKTYITIDQSVIDKAALWIVRHQNVSGAFQEPKYGRVLHSALQGGSAKGLPLTAYVLATLLENKDGISSLSTKAMVAKTINDATIHVESQVYSIKTDAYTLSLVTYALQKAKRPLASTVVQYLNDLVVTEGSKKYWKTETKPVNPPEPMPYWRRHSLAPSNDIEMTAYGLMIYTNEGMVVDGMAVASWLSSQRNSLGGYRSTQDTVIALQALSMFQSMDSQGSEQNISVDVTVDGTGYSFATLSKKNNMVLQSIELTGEASQVGVTATGTGIALIQMTIYYNMMKKEVHEGIELTVDSDVTELGEIIVSACAKWTKEGSSGMVVLQINELTGYETVTDEILSTYGDLGVKRVEKNGKTLNIYIDEFKKDDLCMTVKSVNVDPVANLQDALVSAFVYYSPELRDSSLYMPKAMKNTTVCATCPTCCGGIVSTPVPIDNCFTIPCENGGTCFSDIGGMFACKCVDGFTGPTCNVQGPAAISESSTMSAFTVCTFTIAVMTIFFSMH